MLKLELPKHGWNHKTSYSASLVTLFTVLRHDSHIA